MKTKFKMIACFVILVSIFGMVTGCQAGSKMEMYESYVIDVSNSDASANVKADHYPWPDPERIGSTAKNYRQKLQFMGKDYEGEFLRATAYPLTPETGNVYRTSDGIQFSLSRENGELKYFSFMSKTFFDKEPLLEDVQNPEQAAIDIATRLAEEYIDTSDYTRTVTLDIHSKGTEREYKIYDVDFTRYIQGYITRDTIYVTVTSKGNLAALSIGYLGGFDDFTLEIDKQKVNDHAIAKVKEKYANTPYTVVDIVIENQALTETQTGEIGICSKVKVTLKGASGHTFNAGLSIFTYLCDS